MPAVLLRPCACCSTFDLAVSLYLAAVLQGLVAASLAQPAWWFVGPRAGMPQRGRPSAGGAHCAAMNAQRCMSRFRPWAASCGAAADLRAQGGKEPGVCVVPRAGTAAGRHPVTLQQVRKACLRAGRQAGMEYHFERTRVLGGPLLKLLAHVPRQLLQVALQGKRGKTTVEVRR